MRDRTIWLRIKQKANKNGSNHIVRFSRLRQSRTGNEKIKIKTLLTKKERKDIEPNEGIAASLS